MARIGTAARKAALALKGTKYPAGWCLKFQLDKVVQVPGVGDWDGDRAADAEDFWKAAAAKGKVVKTFDWQKLPANVLTLWTGGSRDNGHAAFYLGDGDLLTTDLPTSGKVGVVHVTEPSKKWGLKLVGYIVKDANGNTLYKKPTTQSAPLKAGRWRVTTRSGLRGREKPSTIARTLRVAPYGEVLKASELVEGLGALWIHAGDAYYSTRYLQKL